jgi:hypothetical protein
LLVNPVSRCRANFCDVVGGILLATRARILVSRTIRIVIAAADSCDGVLDARPGLVFGDTVSRRARTALLCDTIGPLQSRAPSYFVRCNAQVQHTNDDLLTRS